MTNRELIQEQLDELNLDYKIEDLKTFMAWKKEGYKVKKGEKAVLDVYIHVPTHGSKKITETTDEEYSNFYNKRAWFFHRDQVEPI